MSTYLLGVHGKLVLEIDKRLLSWSHPVTVRNLQSRGKFWTGTFCFDLNLHITINLQTLSSGQVKMASMDIDTPISLAPSARGSQTAAT